MNLSVHDAADQATRLYDRAAEAARDRALQVREQALRATDRTAGYIRDEPFKAVLIALVAGAAVMALARLGLRDRDR